MPDKEALRQQLNALLTELQALARQMADLRFFVKVYPAIKAPESGDEFPAGTNIPVTVRSNSGLGLEILMMLEGTVIFPFPPVPPAVPPVAIPTTKVAGLNKWEGTMNVTLPAAPGDYLLICRVAGDSLILPSHHIDKVAITVT